MIELGDLKIKVVEKDFYCRHCKELNLRCLKYHRSGIAFRVWIKAGSKVFSFILSRGEFEGYVPLGADLGWLLREGMSGCREYERGHMTMSGWFTLYSPIYEGEVEEKEFEEEQEEKLNGVEMSVLAGELKEGANQILEAMVKEDPRILNLFWGLWEDKKPLFYIYRRGKAIRLPLGAEIEEIPCSWAAKFKFGEISFGITKRSRYEVSWLKEESGSSWALQEVELGKKKIIYGVNAGRKVAFYSAGGPVYLDLEAKGKVKTERFWAFEGWETAARRYVQYGLGELFFAPARLVREDPEDLLKYRADEALGGFEATIASVPEEDLKVLGGKLRKRKVWGRTEYRIEGPGTSVFVIEGGELRREEKIIVQHRKWGVLVLIPGEYIVLRSPFF